MTPYPYSEDQLVEQPAIGLFERHSDHTRLLDLADNFSLFSEHKAGLVKILG